MHRLFVLSLLLFPALVHAAPRFEIEQLTVDGDVQRVEAVDLDGDGKADLLVAVIRGSGAAAVRELDVFWNLGGHFSAKPDLLLPVEAELCAWDVASLDAGAPASLLAVTPEGVRARGFAGRVLGAWRQLVTQPTIFPRAPKAQLARFKVVQPIGPAGGPALLVPGLTTLSVYVREGEAFVRRSSLELDVEVTVDGNRRLEGSADAPGLRNFALSTRVPSVEITDINGDGRPDLVLVHGDEVRVFLQADGGGYATKPSFVRAFKVRTEKEEKDGKDRDVHVQLVDVDGDGRAEVVITKQVSAGITSATTTVYLYRGTADGFAATPDQVLTTDGASLTGVQLKDLTGDGRPDLIIPSVKIGLFAIVRMITSKKLKVNFQLHPWGVVEKKFALKPTAERSLTFDLDLSGKTQDPQILEMHGDYDGDGHVDLAFGTDEEELSIFPGGKAGVLFADDAVVKIPVRAYGAALPVDLDAQKRSDLVLWYAGSPGHQHEVAVVHNRGN